MRLESANASRKEPQSFDAADPGIAAPGASPSPRRVRVGSVAIDVLSFREALDAVEGLVARRRGGTVFTPNVDHVVFADEDPRFGAAYRDVDLSLVDGMPVLWASRALGTPLPEKISGSDLLRPLAARAAARGWGIYLLGAGPGVAERARGILEEEFPGLRVVGVSSPKIDLADDLAAQRAILDGIRAARPDLLFLALNTPKQEIWAHRIREAVSPTVVIGVGAGVDFVAGEAKRAPRWVSNAGFEWLFRLSREPGRLWRRYLLRDPKFLGIVLRQALERRVRVLGPGRSNPG
jgi:N-acetylglucosaminyldiphosphoundecaprenol N-acetyl-beta-D-mannosaminyltransferase